jgi:assimilatory nitrate reductase catalytic subunit
LGLYKRVSPSPGEALADFYIFKLIADYWGCGDLFEEWESPEAVFEILKKLSRGTPADFSGIRDYKMLDDNGGVQWPCPEGLPAENGVLRVNERRLFEDGRFYHPDGKARFLFEEPRSLYESLDRQFPLVLLTGRGSASQWHTQTRTSKSAVLRKLYPKDPHVEIHPDDAGPRGVADGHWVQVVSRRGKIQARACVTPTVGAGRVFMAMHDASVNLLTFPAFDPYSRQPSYKFSAVDIMPT